MKVPGEIRCELCNAKLARDNASSICSPCKRGEIERAARDRATIARDRDSIKAEFETAGLPGVATRFGISASQALSMLLGARLIPAVSPRREQLLCRLVALGDVSHVDAADALGISRWTVATYRSQLGIGKAGLGDAPRALAR